MPYCKFCGTELKDGKLCTCPDAAAERQQKNYVPPKPPAPLIPEGKPITAEMLGIDSRKFVRKSVIIPAISITVAVAVLIFLGLFSGSRYQKPVELLTKGICDTRSELILKALYPESFTEELTSRLDENEEDIEDITDDLNDLIDELTDICDDDYFGGNMKITLDYLSKSSPSERMQGQIEDYYNEYFNAEVSRIYKVKIFLTVKGDDNTLDSRLNLYSVKLKGDRWVVYIPEKTIAKFEKDFSDMYKAVEKSAKKTISSYEDSLEYFTFD